MVQNEDFESFVCLNKNKDIVSVEKGFAPEKDGKKQEAIGIGEIFKNSNCGGKWCWVNSADANNQFKVITIKKPGEEPFDVVSNADDWLMCNAITPEAEKTFKGGLAHKDIKEWSNRFYCYQEGNRWSWAECAGDWDARKNPSIKGRYTGEGLYTLPLSILPADQVPGDPKKAKEAGDYLRETLEGPVIPITYDSLYKKYYGRGFLDFTGYTHLNLMVRFVDKDDTTKPAEIKDLKFPLAINLAVKGPKKNDVIYLQRNILGDVINAPFADLNNEHAAQGFMHLKVPIAEYKAVREIVITANAGNFIQVRNVYLTNDNEGSNLLCSGQGAQDENSWLKDADAGIFDAEINGKDLCTALYGKKAWLGLDTDVDELEPSANCCGNAANEYYAGISKENVPLKGEQGEAAYYGCWNSQPIASGDTIMDIQFNVSYFDTSYAVTYQDISLPAVGQIIHASPVPEDPGNNFCPNIDCKYAEN
ncbi:MAG: hypothetical protein AABX31_04170, partial [Nanoarchaeota archaeon]